MPSDAGRPPCVVMVHGSGPQDRDGNIKGFETQILRRLAEHLADHGIASLRYDKRGCGESQGRFDTAGLSDFVQDAHSAIDFVATGDDADFESVYVLGHSEGAVLSPEICLENSRAAGAVMLCASLRSLEEDLVRNARVLNDDLARRRGLRAVLARWLFHSKDPAAEVEALRRKVADTRKETIRVSFSRVSTKFYRETFEYDVKRHLSRLAKPILAIGGGKDFQCLAEDTRLIAEIAAGPVEVGIVENMNHMLRNQEGPPSMLGYKAQGEEPIAGDVSRLVVDWIHRRSAGRPGPADRDGIG